MLRGADWHVLGVLENKGKFQGDSVAPNSMERIVKSAIDTGVFGMIGSVWDEKTVGFSRIKIRCLTAWLRLPALSDECAPCAS
jgi:hypothetical protein